MCEEQGGTFLLQVVGCGDAAVSVQPSSVSLPCTEALAFSCFTELMKRMNQNFPHGGAMDTHFANMRSLIQVGGSWWSLKALHRGVWGVSEGLRGAFSGGTQESKLGAVKSLEFRCGRMLKPGGRWHSGRAVRRQAGRGGAGASAELC